MGMSCAEKWGYELHGKPSFEKDEFEFDNFQ